MTDDLLTFELDAEKEQLFIHGDATGLHRLAKILEHLANLANNGDFPHDHLFTEEWGGDGLSSEEQENDHLHLNHVKIYGWPNKEGAKPYKKSQQAAMSGAKPRKDDTHKSLDHDN